MPKGGTNPEIDAFFDEAGKWRDAFGKLRSVILRCPLTEELKWGKPCYTHQGRNVVLIQGFKDYCALLFCEGALLKDAEGVLIRPGENTQAARQIRFADAREIARMGAVVKAYVDEAIEAKKSGLEVKYKKTSDFPVPGEFQAKLDRVPGLKAAFEALTPGRQRGYLLFFAAPKQSKTRDSRVGKCIQRIFDGKGLHD